MKVKLIKRMVRQAHHKQGFALLFAVLISSLLLSIGLSIFSITLKELAISTAARQSIHAFFAADSGREYALYHDIKLGDLQLSPAIDFSLTNVEQNPIGSIDKTFVISDTNRTDDANFNVSISKHKPAGANTTISTTITSYGHDSDADDRVERAIEQTY